MVGALFVTAGCGGGNQTKLRFMNASPNIAGFDVIVDDKTIASGIGYGNNSGYLPVSSGARHLQIETSGTTNILLDQTLNLDDASQTTYLATNVASSISAMVLNDSTVKPSDGNATLRLVNASPSLGAVDVYVVTAGSDLASATPVVRSFGFQGSTDYQTLAAGDYQVVMTVPGSTFPLVDTGTVNLTAGQNRTVVALNGISGGFTATVLADLN
jgi:hypothetical protein